MHDAIAGLPEPAASRDRAGGRAACAAGTVRRDDTGLGRLCERDRDVARSSAGYGRVGCGRERDGQRVHRCLHGHAHDRRGSCVSTTRTTADRRERRDRLAAVRRNGAGVPHVAARRGAGRGRERRDAGAARRVREPAVVRRAALQRGGSAGPTGRPTRPRAPTRWSTRPRGDVGGATISGLSPSPLVTSPPAGGTSIHLQYECHDGAGHWREPAPPPDSRRASCGPGPVGSNGNRPQP